MAIRQSSQAWKIINLSGMRFGRLLVKSYLGIDRHSALWECHCDCGNSINVRASLLREGKTKSCGCLKRDSAKAPKLHGASNEPWFLSWNSMVQRCTNPKERGFKNYGGRGIFVCNRWLNPWHFYQDMGNRPQGMSLERIDNDGPYSPENCRWATRHEQRRNCRKIRLITYNGTTKCMKDWALELGIHHRTLQGRLDTGFSVEEAFNHKKHAKRIIAPV